MKNVQTEPCPPTASPPHDGTLPTTLLEVRRASELKSFKIIGQKYGGRKLDGFSYKFQVRAHSVDSMKLRDSCSGCRTNQMRHGLNVQYGQINCTAPCSSVEFLNTWKTHDPIMSRTTKKIEALLIA